MAKIATFYDHMVDIARQESLSVVEALKLAREMGIEAVEASGNNIVGREDEFGQEIAMADLGISSIPSFFHFDEDQDVKKQAAPILEAAQFLGADRLLVIPGFWAEGDSPQVREEKTQQMIRCVARLGELAPRYGVSLVMEDFDSQLSPIATAEGLLRFLEGCPGLSCAFDTGNFRYAGQDVLEAYTLLRGRVGHVHLKDLAYTQSNGENPKTAVDGTDLYPAPVGSGDLPLDQVMARLRQDGYNGIYTIEHYDSNRTLDYLRQSVEWVKAQLNG